MADATVLIVESDILVRHPLAEYLRECGYRVIETVNVNEAREFIASQTTKVDVVLVEVLAAGKGGFILADWIRRQHSSIKVVLAGTVTKVVQEAGDLCEDGPSLTKPYSHQLVLDHIRRSLARKRRD